MIEMCHHDDGKQKYQSHEIHIREHGFYNAEANVSTLNPFDLYGYGETKEEAIEDFINKFKCVMKELKLLEITLIHTDEIRKKPSGFGTYLGNSLKDKI